MSDEPGTTTRKSRKRSKHEETKSEDSPEKLDKKTILQAKKDLKELLGRDPTVQEVAKFLKAMRDLPPAEEKEWTKVDPDLVKRAQADLKQLLGRDPRADEIQKFLTDMMAPSTVSEDSNQQQENNGSKSLNGWVKVDQDTVAKAQRELKEELGRDPTAAEVQDKLKQQESPAPKGATPVDPARVKEAQRVLKRKLGRDPSGDEVAKQLEESNAPTTNAKEEPEPLQRVDQQRVDEAQANLKKKLGRAPTTSEMEEYLKNGSSGANWAKVDPNLVTDIQNDLKEVLGRDPTAKEVEDFLADLQSEPEPTMNDPNLKETAREDLRELMGREPTEKELQDFLKDLQEDTDTAEMGPMPIFGNPLLGFELEQRRNLPGDPYTAKDAIQDLKEQGYSNPSDAQINDWLFEHNEGFVGLPSMAQEDIPGITSSYHSPAASYDIFSSTSIFFLFLMMVLGGLFYKMRNKKATDDEYVKQDQGNGVYEKFFNPFNRKNDGDDDFDKVL